MYNFDAIIDRRNTACVKYDNLANVFGITDILPMWVADMDFQVAPEIRDAVRQYAEKVFSDIPSEPMRQSKPLLIGWPAAMTGK